MYLHYITGRAECQVFIVLYFTLFYVCFIALLLPFPVGITPSLYHTILVCQEGVREVVPVGLDVRI